MRTAPLLVLALLCLPTAAADAPPANEPPKLPFPDVEGWTRTDLRPLPKQSGGGYSVAYNSAEPRVTVTVYVFNRGRATIPADLADPVLTKEFEDTKNAIHEAKRQGVYKEAQEESSGQSRLGPAPTAPKTLHARFLIGINGRTARSDIHLLSHQNQFVKVRATRTPDPDKPTDDKLDRLYAALAKMLTP
jgi:hypothetical protein